MSNDSHKPNYYQILGIPQTASLENIKKAYRNLARGYHPDKLSCASEPIRKLAEDKLKEINQAYEVLKDTGKRQKHDHELQTTAAELKKQELIRQIQELVENSNLEGAIKVAKSLYELFCDDSDCQTIYAELAYALAIQLVEDERLGRAESYFQLAIDISTDEGFKRRVQGDIGLLRSRRKEEPPRSSATERERAEAETTIKEEEERWCREEEKRVVATELRRREEEKRRRREAEAKTRNQLIIVGAVVMLTIAGVYRYFAFQEQSALERKNRELALREAEERQQQAEREAEKRRQAEQEAEKQRQKELPSAVGINYTRLRDLLAAEQWKDADEETLAVIVNVLGRSYQPSDIQRFPCKDLRTIDQLWINYSGRRFGFSVQQRIWQEESLPRLYTPGRNLSRFDKRVGWMVNGSSLSYDDLNFSRNAPQGHLPFRFTKPNKDFNFAGNWIYLMELFSHLKNCSN